MDKREEKLRSEIIQHIHDWIKGGMREEELATRKIDEMIASAISQARSQAYEECAKISEGYGSGGLEYDLEPEACVAASVASKTISQAIREASNTNPHIEKVE